jgi:hypothetical protein
MKRLIASIASTAALLIAGLGGSFASAANGSWFLKVSQLSTYTTSHSFNVQYTVLSTNQGVNFCVQLFQNDVLIATENTLNPSDSNTDFGNSGSFPVTVAADNTYNYKVMADMDSCDEPADTQSGSTTTKVDTAAPGAPNYLGKSASGSNTTVNFTAPSDSDVATVNIYAGSSKTYDGDNSHLLKTVAVSAGQTYHETVNASPSLFFSVQAFDQAGNGSGIVGDPGTVVNPVRFVNNGVTAGGTGGGGATTTGQVLGVSTGNGTGNGSTNGSSQGEVNAPGSSKTNKNSNNGKVLGAAITDNNSKAWQWTGIVIVILFVLGLLYRLFLWPANKKP